ncbi:hypothetical protein [Alteromonas sp. C1M14]|uniref:hypothetical protein n=1 Tax=Alteromonas sp. C1M14 TaxID=2841567 RepID=UPI001C0965E6|nr:hypothetical protein [Alteromonas sp. C1M14]MBU2978993.1 hypothetical protein [Alteromonas sp. C1M14]
MNDFSSRLQWMLAGRKANPWAKKLGISSGSVSRMLNNEPPGTEILTLIMRTEHVNLSWLLGGHGMPFMLDIYTCASEFEDMLSAHNQDANYDAYLCDNPNTKQLAVILSEPATCTFKNKTIEYNHVEMLLGPRRNSDIEGILNRCNVRYFSMDALNFKAFSRGQFGTYKMIDDDNKYALTLTPPRIQTPALSASSGHVLVKGRIGSGKSSQVFYASTGKIKSYTSKEKGDLLHTLIDVAESNNMKDKLDPETKLRTLSFLEKSGKPPSEITSDDIRYALLATMH